MCICLRSKLKRYSEPPPNIQKQKNVWCIYNPLMIIIYRSFKDYVLKILSLCYAFHYFNRKKSHWTKIGSHDSHLTVEIVSFFLFLTILKCSLLSFFYIFFFFLLFVKRSGMKSCFVLTMCM